MMTAAWIYSNVEALLDSNVPVVYLPAMSILGRMWLPCHVRTDGDKVFSNPTRARILLNLVASSMLAIFIHRAPDLLALSEAPPQCLRKVEGDERAQ